MKTRLLLEQCRRLKHLRVCQQSAQNKIDCEGVDTENRCAGTWNIGIMSAVC